MPEDLYEARIERVDLVGLVAGGVALIAGSGFGVHRVVVAGAVVAGAALALAALNLTLVVWAHVPIEWRGGRRDRSSTGE